MEMWQQMRQIPLPQGTSTTVRKGKNTLVSKLANVITSDAEMFCVRVNGVIS